MKLELSDISLRRIARVLRGQDADVVTDDATGLMWEVGSSGNISWDEAMRQPSEIGQLGGFSDWRLPTKEELVSLYSSGLLPSSDYFWSSSEYTSDNTVAYGVYMGNGSDFGEYKTEGSYKARCVRG